MLEKYIRKSFGVKAIFFIESLGSSRFEAFPFPYKNVIELQNRISLQICKDFSFNILYINRGFSPELLPAAFSNKSANNSEVTCVAVVENVRVVANSLRLRQSGLKISTTITAN